MTNRAADASTLVYARIAGFVYLLIIVIAVLNTYFVDSRLIVPGDDAATVHNIMANDLRFRIGIAATLIMYASVVVLSVALYVTLKTVDRNLALLAMLLRLAEAVVGCVTVFTSLLVLHLLEREGPAAAFDAQQLQALVGLFLDARTAALDVVLLLVGLGGAVFCYLFLRSRYVPGLLASWGVFTYLSMVFLALVSILVPDHPAMLENVLYALGGSFELLFGFWLLAKGINVHQGNGHSPGTNTS